MTIPLPGCLLDALRQFPLLEPQRLAELPGLKARFPEPRALARELIQRDWLTPYQVNQLFQGRGQDLVLGQYVVLERLGEGGMGQVFKARHRSLGRLVALKVIRKEKLSQPNTVRRFHREVQAMAQLGHPNVVRAFDADEAGGTHLFAMEYVEGIDLARLVREKGPLAIDQACDYIQQAALGLQHAHERGMVHRDIKPSNLLVTGLRSGQEGGTPGETRRPGDAAKDGVLPVRASAGLPLAAPPSPWGTIKILDMGLALLDRPEDTLLSTQLTQEGSVIGTPDFIAPEQAKNSHAIDIRADLYSLGCTFYYLLTGQVPFEGATLMEKLLHHQLDTPRPVEQLRREVPPDVAVMVRKLMAKRPEDRFQTPAALADVLAHRLEWDVIPITPRPRASGVRRAPRKTGPIAPPASLRNPKPVSSPLRRPVLPRQPVPAPAPETVELTPPPPTLPVRTTGRRRWLRLALGGALLLLSAVAFMGLVLEPDLGTASTTTLRKEDATEAALAALRARAADPKTELEQLRSDIIRFRVRHAGTPRAQKAAELLTQLPSSLDRLAGALVAARFPRQPKELVAVLGKRRVPALGKNGEPIWKAVHAVACSPDGRHLASGGFDNLVRFWDPAGSSRPTLGKGHEGHVLAAVYAPDGQTLATAGVDATIRLWDPAAARERLILTGHRQRVSALAFAPDGRTLASVSWDRTVKLWDPATGKEKATLTHQTGRPLGVAFAPDSRWLAWGSTDHTVQLWDLRGAEPRRAAVYRGNTSWVLVTTFSPDGKVLVSGGGGDGTLRVCRWDGTQFTERFRLTGHRRVVHSVVFAPDGKTLVSAGHDGRVIFWETATGTPVRTWEFPWPVYSVAFAPDGRHLAAANAIGTVSVYRVAPPPVR